MIEDSEEMEDAIESVVQRVLYNEVSTFFPAQITSVRSSKSNANTKVVDVVSSFLVIDPTTNTTRPKAIQNIPLMMVGRTNTFMIRPPLDELSLVGAYVGLIVSNNYLANWKKTGGTVLPTDGRKYHYADAVAMFGLAPDLSAWPTPPKENTGQIKALDGTFLEIGNGSTDIFRLISDMANIITTATTLVAGSPVPLTLLPSALSGKTLAQLVVELTTITNPDPTP